MDEGAKKELGEKVSATITGFQSMFKNIDHSLALRAQMSLMWYSSLPCFDVKGLTSDKNGEKSILKVCKWKGRQYPCSSIFKKVATDKGICCAFNKPAADQIFAKSSYSDITAKLEREEKLGAADRDEFPNSKFEEKLLNSQTGSNMGLSVMLDAHTDLLSEFSVTSDFAGFTAIISPPADFPLMTVNEFDVKPGHVNNVALSAIKLDADEGIRNIDPVKRNCYFADDISPVKLFKEYSQSNCLLEVSLRFGQRKLQVENNSPPCTPWFIPIVDDNYQMCNPWEKKRILEIVTGGVPQTEFSICLPDCKRTLYHTRITTQVFRVCDEKNFGMTELCNLTNTKLQPQIWGAQVLDQLGNESLLKDVLQSGRRTITKILQEPLFTTLNRSYDAFEKDIAQLNVFFSGPTAMLYTTKESKTWFDFISMVGGNGGLFIGFSLVTTIEVIYTLIKIVCLYLQP